MSPNLFSFLFLIIYMGMLHVFVLGCNLVWILLFYNNCFVACSYFFFFLKNNIVMSCYENKNNVLLINVFIYSIFA